MEVETNLGTVHVSFYYQRGKALGTLIAFWGGQPGPGNKLPFARLQGDGINIRARGVFAKVRSSERGRRRGSLGGWVSVEQYDVLHHPDDPVPDPVARLSITESVRQGLTDSNADRHDEAVAARRGSDLFEALSRWKQGDAARISADESSRLAQDLLSGSEEA